MNDPSKQPFGFFIANARMIFGFALFWGALITLASAQEVALTPESTLRFATPEEGAALLATEDDFIQVMSPLDRSLRVGRKGVSQAELLEYVSAQTLAWTPQEVERLSGLAEAIAENLEGLSYELPEGVLMVKTTGQDEFGAAYTRQNAIVFPQNFLQAPDAFVGPVLAHELFHVLSRANPEGKDALYEVIGFTPCESFEYPDELADIKITNPDAPLSDHTISVSQGEVLPVLFIEDEVDLGEQQSVGQLLSEGVLQFKMLAVDETCHATREAGALNLYDVDKLEGFFEQTGQNTGYIIHPEEILADNFAFLVTRMVPGTENGEIPNPEIPEAMAEVLGLN